MTVIISNQISIWYESVAYCSKNKEITFPQEFIFVFNPYIIGTILSEKCCPVGGGQKNT